MTLQIQTSLQVVNTAGFTFPRVGGRSISIDQAVEGGGVPGFQKLTADTPESVNIAELTTLGVMYIRNTHTTVIVEVGQDVAAAFVAFGEVRPGEEFTWRLKAGMLLQLKAIGGAGEVQLYIFED